MGALECWSIGVLAKELMSFFSTLQYPITPVLQDRDFQKLLAALKLPFYWPSSIQCRAGLRGIAYERIEYHQTACG